MIATLREPATAAPAAPVGGIPEVPARVAGTVSAVRVSAGFTSPHQLRVELAKGGTTVIDFEQAIIAAGFEPLTLPFIPASDPRIMDSTGALEVGEVPERLLILGGGIMGLEMATVYHELGAKVTIAELMDGPNAPPELATTLDTLDRLAADHITKAGVPHRSLTTVTVRTQRRGGFCHARCSPARHHPPRHSGPTSKSRYRRCPTLRPGLRAEGVAPFGGSMADVLM